MKKLILLAASILLIATSSAHADTIKAEPGLWKTTISSSQNGQSMPMPSTTCVTQKQIDDAENAWLKNPMMQQEGCKKTDFQQTSNTVHVKIECSGDMQMVNDISMKFDSKTHYTGTMKMTGSMMGQPMNNTMTIEGTRVGPCTAADSQ